MQRGFYGNSIAKLEGKAMNYRPRLFRGGVEQMSRTRLGVYVIYGDLVYGHATVTAQETGGSGSMMISLPHVGVPVQPTTTTLESGWPMGGVWQVIRPGSTYRHGEVSIDGTRVNGVYVATFLESYQEWRLYAESNTNNDYNMQFGYIIGGRYSNGSPPS